MEERGRNGRADLSKFAEKAKSLAERSSSARQEIAGDVKNAEVATGTAEAYSEVGRRIYGYVQTCPLKLYLPFSGNGGLPIQAVDDAT